jgi:hypothetical protein
MGRVVYRSGHIGEMGGVRFQDEPVSCDGFEPRLCRSPNPFTILEKPKYVPG